VALVAGRNSAKEGGCAYLWERNLDGSWPTTPTRNFNKTDNSVYGYYGLSCALSGDGTVALVSGMESSGLSSYGGVAFVYLKQSNGEWSEYDLSLTNVNGNYGRSCALSADGKVALITGYDNNINANNGTAWVWKFDGTNWYKDASLSRQDVSSRYGISCSLSADGTIAMIGGKSWGTEGGQGQVYFWKYDGSSWSVLSDHTVSSTNRYSVNACALASSGNYAIATEERVSGTNMYPYEFHVSSGTTGTVTVDTNYATYSNVENSFNRVLYWNHDIDTDITTSNNTPFTNTYLNYGTVFGATTTVHAQLSLTTSANVLGNVWMFGVTGTNSENYSNFNLQNMVTTILPGKTIQTDYVTLSNVGFDLYLDDITLGNVFSAIDGSPTTSRITDLAANAVNAVIVALEGNVYHAAYKNTNAGSSTKTSSWTELVLAESNIISLYEPRTFTGGLDTGEAVSLSYDGNVALVTSLGYGGSSSGGDGWIWRFSNSRWTMEANLSSTNEYYGSKCVLSGDGNTAIIVSTRANDNDSSIIWKYSQSSSTWSESKQLNIKWNNAALSYDGNVALFVNNYEAGSTYNNANGLAWIYRFTEGTGWTNTSPKDDLHWNASRHSYTSEYYLTGTQRYGESCALSADGTKALVSGNRFAVLFTDNGGANWNYKVITNAGSDWNGNEQNISYGAHLGTRCAMSGDGSKIILCGNKTIAFFDEHGECKHELTDIYGDLSDPRWTSAEFNVSMSNIGDSLLITDKTTASTTGSSSRDSHVHQYVASDDQYYKTHPDTSDQITLPRPSTDATDYAKNVRWGKTCAISGDGNTVVIGGNDSDEGSVWLYRLNLL